MSNQVSGIAPGERQLLGPQTTGRTYRNLSQPVYTVQSYYDLAFAQHPLDRAMAGRPGPTKCAINRVGQSRIPGPTA